VGQISFGERNVVQTQATIMALQGEVVFGEGNVVEELCRIQCNQERPFVIGSGNFFEAKSELEDCQVCDFCIIGTGAKLKNVVLVGGNYIAPKVFLEGEVLDKDVHVFLKDGKQTLSFCFFFNFFVLRKSYESRRTGVYGKARYRA
jgi:hypothetical protein